jgi:hypothetical protein
MDIDVLTGATSRGAHREKMMKNRKKMRGGGPVLSDGGIKRP